MRKLLLIILLFSLLAPLYGQSFKSYYNQFEFKTHYGMTVPHHSKIKYLLKSNILIAELNYSIKTDGSKPWHHLWRFPELGIGFLMGGTGNINVLGFSRSLYGFLGVPIIEKDRLLFKYRMGVGIGLLSDNFDNQSNYYNIVIGSKINAHLHLSFLLDYKLSSDYPLYISAGLAYNHFSNGGFKMPNLGLNQISGNIGIKYLFSEYSYSLPKRTLPYMYNSKYELSAYYASSLKDNSTYETKRYFIHSAEIDFAIRTNYKRSYGGGINIIYDPSLRSLLGDKYKGQYNLLRIGVHGLHEVYISEQFSIVITAGFYLLNSYKYNKSFLIYTKAGLRYTFSNNSFINIVLKTHAAAADYIEFGLGYRFLN